MTPKPRVEKMAADDGTSMRDRLEELETLLGELPVGVFIAHDPECTRISMNPAGAKMLRVETTDNPSLSGPNAAELPFRVLQDGLEVPACDLPMQRAARLGKPVSGEEFEVEFANGDTVTLFEFAAPLFDAQGRPRGSVGVFSDITDRRRWEQTLAGRARCLTALYELTDRLRLVTEPDAIYEAALDSILIALRADRASLLLFDGEGVMRFVAWRMLSETYRRAVEGHSPWRMGEPDAKPFGIEDVETADIGAELRAAVRAEGIRSLAFVPLMSGERLIGKFMVYFDAPHTYDEDELELALTFGRQIAIGIERGRSESERLQAEAALRNRARQQQAVARLGEFALRERDLQKVFNYAATSVAATLSVEYCKILERLPCGDELLMRAGTGWKGDVVGTARLSAGLDSQAGYTLMSDSPVVVADLARESRFRGPPLLHEHGVVSGMTTIIRDGSGSAWGVIGMHSTRRIDFTEDDVSFLVAVANILSNAIARDQYERALQEADRRKDEFLATLSHELRNPLAPLRNALSVLRLASPAGSTIPIQEMMERQVNHLVRLVDDLLEVSRISRGTFELRRERADVAMIVTNAVETSQPLIQGSRHRLTVSLPSEPVFVEGDPVRLSQVLSNLLNNAARYTAPEGTIELVARREPAAVTIAVRDNGVGISPESLPHIFDMFNRGDRPSGETGLGIGLALARRVAEMHGGSLSVRSAGPGTGSEFTLRLPTQVASATEERKSARPPAAALQRNILVVDDNREAAESLGMLLRFLGADVRIAHDGPQAIEVCASYEPAVVLLDIGMPGMDGYEVARRLRARFTDRRTLLVALTGWGQEEDRRRAREAGFDHHLIKPADLDTLQKLLATVGTTERDRGSRPARR